MAAEPPIGQQAPGETPPAKKPSSVFATVGAVFVLTLVAAGAGGALGLQLFSVVDTAAKQKAVEKADKPPPEYSGDLTVKPIPPVVTNLANPKSTFIRIEASLIFEGEVPSDADALAAQISADALAFLRTVTLAQIEGATGLLHLREDLTERAKIRSKGRVRELVIQALAVE